jgi:geranylgeranyl transferase type-1 subunit beta
MADHDVAGYTYCAIASLSILNRLPASMQKHAPQTPANAECGLTNVSGTIRWLLSRQLAYSEFDDESENYGQGPLIEHLPNGSDHTHPDDELPPLDNLTLHEPFSIGFNGRLNKPVDTCYCFWVCGSLEVHEYITKLSFT